MKWLWLALACRGPVDTGPTAADTEATTSTETEASHSETEPDTETASETQPEDTAHTEPPDPDDQDGDGHRTEDDCDDTDPDVFPGATETWNEVDDDCDGRIDGDGDYSGTLTLDARGIYEGTTYTWQLSCPMTLSRATVEVDFLATCDSDPDDEMAVLLLGERITITPRRTSITGATWDRTVDTTSSGGWDSSSGEMQLSWPDLETVTVSYTLDGFALDMWGSGSLTWSGP